MSRPNSLYYCSVQLHNITGTTIKYYMATLSVRDTDKRIIDIDFEYGYSAQSVHESV